MTNLLLWADFETTGLNPQMDTILEAAWTITDEDLRMLTPLRSRLCLIDPPHRRRDANLYPEHPLRNQTKFEVGHPDKDDAFNHWHLLPPVVRDMHDESGLKDALVHAANHPVESLGMVTTANGLWRLLADDLLDAGYNFRDDKLVLSGAGVSHFDNQVFAHHMPGRFPLGGGEGFAYWQHDVSVARRVIGEKAWAALAADADRLPAAHPIYRCESHTPVREGYAPSWTVGAHPDAPDNLAFDSSQLTGHRAADDVVRALIDGRILRAATGWSVK